MTPHAILELRSGAGELIWRYDRDGKKPEQVLTPQVAMDMNQMMNKVVEEGTGKRAILEGIQGGGQDRDHQLPIATPGSSASPATTSAASGTATTTTFPPSG